MAPLTPSMNLASLAKVRDAYAPDSTKPNSMLLYCDFHLPKIGNLTIPVLKYIEGRRAPETGSLVFISGSFWMLPETDGSIEADTFEVVTEDASLALNLPPPSVNAIGTVALVIGRDVFMDVGAYSCETKQTVDYKIIVTVPDDRRRARMKLPQPGSNIAVRGILSHISIHAEIDIPAIELENLSYLPRTDATQPTTPSKPKPAAGIRTKRQLLAKRALGSVDVGNPMKKTKSGPPEAFTLEELRGKSHAGPSSSQTSASNLSLPAVSDASSQSSTGDFSSPVKNTKASLRSAKLEAQKA
ncbi:unnamed protein product [Rhizoctonia solani]|uniref:Uncharacterized protein n=1 Tax=Rhizoctonia solani TaxID=456999 RepID=A0A8H3GPI0_9AGAM|nr:unnamed protein product [Rhizoctonia solani]